MSGFGLTAADIAELEKMVAPEGEALPVQEMTQQAVDEAPAQDAAPQDNAGEAAAMKAASEPDAPVAPRSDEESIRPVPYNRFKEVNAERAALKAERDALANQLAEERAKLEAMRVVEAEKPKASEKSWLDRVLDGDDDGQEPVQKQPEEIPAWARPVLSVIEQVQMDRQMAELDRVVAGIRQDYPDMPEEVVLSGIAAGQSPHEIAVAWDNLGRAYTQAHGYVQREQAQQAQAPAQQQRSVDVAPKLSTAKGQLNAPEPKSWVQGWGKDHQQAVAQFIKMQG